MTGISAEIVGLLYHLLPGFVAAWIFYGLTAYRKDSPFERVVQALIFTMIVQALVIALRSLLLWIGRWLPLGIWSADTAITVSVLVAIVVGLVSARLANNNVLHEWLRHWKLYDRVRSWHWLSWLPEWEWTSKTSCPSEWFSLFRGHKRWIILHLAGNRRLYGWPEEWPDHPDQGQFVIDQPEWLLPDGSRATLYEVARLLIPSRDVEAVEFLYNDDEVTADPADIKQVHERLLAVQKKGADDGDKSTTTSAQPATGRGGQLPRGAHAEGGGADGTEGI